MSKFQAPAYYGNQIITADGRLVPIDPATGFFSPIDDRQEQLLRAMPGVSVVAAYRQTIILAQSAIPVILAPSGTISASGVVTLGTALQATYQSAWVFFPAGAVVGDATGGLYFCVFGSPMVGNVYAVKFGGASGATGAFTPTVQSGLPIAIGSGSAFTQTVVADIALANITVPGGLMGASGSLRVTCSWSANGTATNKGPQNKFGGVIVSNGVAGSSMSTLNFARTQAFVANRGVASQISNPYVFFGATNATNFTSINTAIDQPLLLTGNIAVATDALVLEGFTVEVLPGV